MAKFRGLGFRVSDLFHQPSNADLSGVDALGAQASNANSSGADTLSTQDFSSRFLQCRPEKAGFSRRFHQPCATICPTISHGHLSCHQPCVTICPTISHGPGAGAIHQPWARHLARRNPSLRWKRSPSRKTIPSSPAS